jgi:Ca-activated chloride channel family protein
MFNPQTFENSRPDGFGVLEISAEPDSSEPRRFVPLKRTELRGQVHGPLAELRLVQTFGFPDAAQGAAMEALYRFPLPGNAAVTAVWVRFGEVLIRTQLKRRREAEGHYEQAKKGGRQAVLLTRETPDVFTLQVAGIQPGQDVVVETAYVQLARAEGIGWSLRIPLTTAPRFVREDETFPRQAQGQPLALLRDPGHRFALDLVFADAAQALSPTHKLEVQRETGRLRICLSDKEVIPDRDCVLYWQPAQKKNTPLLRVFLHDDGEKDQVYFLALLTPSRDRGKSVPREMVLLVDHSGSMEGPKWQAADWAVERFAAGMTVHDYLVLGAFHNTARWMVRKPSPVTPQLRQETVQFLKKYRDSGGTELAVALEQALALDRTPGDLARHVLIITDAQVSDTGRIWALADRVAQRPDRRRISVLCIDSAPHEYLANELAERGGGLARFLTSDPDQEDIATALDDVLNAWGEPVLSALRLEVNREQVQAAGRSVLDAPEPGWSAIDLGDLPAGRPPWVAGRVPRGSSGKLTFRVTNAKHWKSAGCELDLHQETPRQPAIKALFGACRVNQLEAFQHAYPSADQLRRLGYDADKLLDLKKEPTEPLYVAPQLTSGPTPFNDLLVEEALAYGLASSETAFFAARTEAGRPVEQTVAVANALPAGWSKRFQTPNVFLAGRGLSIKALAVASPPDARILMAREQLEEHLEADSLSGAELKPVFKKTIDQAPTRPVVVFRDVPVFAGNEAVLFDTSRPADTAKLPDQATLSSLELRFPDGAPDTTALDSGLMLLVFVADLVMPRARVRLSDLVRQRGKRPLNLLKQPGQIVRLVLVDPAAAWSQGAPRLEIALGW